MSRSSKLSKHKPAASFSFSNRPVPSQVSSSSQMNHGYSSSPHHPYGQQQSQYQYSSPQLGQYQAQISQSQSQSYGFPSQPQYTPPPGPPPGWNGSTVGGSTSSPSGNIKSASSREERQKVWTACKSGESHARLLHEALVYAQPGDLKDNPLVQELLSGCRVAQEHISSQISWASSEAERSRREADLPAETPEEQLLAALLSCNEEILEAIKMCEDAQKVDKEKEKQSFAEMNRKLKTLNAVAKFKPTPSETTLVDRIFNAAGTSPGSDSVGKDILAQLFRGFRLPASILADIFKIANVEESDKLSRHCVGVAVRLAGHAQRAEKVEYDIVAQPGLVPTIEGLEARSPTSPKQPEPGPSSSSLPPLTEQDRDKFMRIFQGSGPNNGVIPGNKARDLLMRSRLPMDKLAQIWDVADQQKRGELDENSFVVAMYLIQGSMSGHIKTIPTELPPSIITAASSKGMFSPSSDFVGGFALQGSSSGSGSYFPPGAQAGPSSQPIAGPSTMSHWDVTPEMKATADAFFEVMDEKRQGYLEEKVARAHFIETGMTDEHLSHIWRLVDMNRDNRLTRDEFAMALYLIQASQNGQPLPLRLPDSLIPPGMRPPAPSSYPGKGRTPARDSLIDFDDSTTVLPVPSIPSSPLARSPTQFGPPVPPKFPTSPGPPPAWRQRSGSTPSLSRTPSVPFRSSPTSPSLPPPANWQWTISAIEKENSDKFFETLDPWKQGVIRGDVAAPFLAKSKLSPDVLGEIWDLADIDHSGALSKDEFAIAMHLTRAKLAGVELPTALPDSLKPPLVTEDPFASHEDDVPAPAPVPAPPPPAPEPSSTVSTVIPPAPDEEMLRSSTPPPPYESLPPTATSET